MLSNIGKENLIQLAEIKYWQGSGVDAYQYRPSIIGKEQRRREENVQLLFVEAE